MRQQKSRNDALDRHDRKLALILETAARLFAEEGYEKASIRRISAEMNMSLAGLYHYFKSKEELLFLIQYSTFDALLTRLRRELAGEEDPRRKLFLVARNHFSYFIEHMNELKVCSHDLETLSGDFFRRVEQRRKDYFRLVHGVVKEIREHHGSGSPNTRISTFFLFGMLNWIYRWYGPASRYTSETLADNLVTLFLDGVVPRNVNGVPDRGK